MEEEGRVEIQGCIALLIESIRMSMTQRNSGSVKVGAAI
jgi:hypothetical protein